MQKIVTVCGMGIGTSVLLKMNVEKVLRARGQDAIVIASDIESAPEVAADATYVLTSPEFAGKLVGLPAEVTIISSFFDLDEIDAKLARPTNEE